MVGLHDLAPCLRPLKHGNACGTGGSDLRVVIVGGGSADAAAVLKLLNHLCAEAGEEPLNTAELLYLGLRIGADVPLSLIHI